MINLIYKTFSKIVLCGLLALSVLFLLPGVAKAGPNDSDAECRAAGGVWTTIPGAGNYCNLDDSTDDDTPPADEPPDQATARTAPAESDGNWVGEALQWALGASVLLVFGQIGVILLSFTALVLGFAGTFFNLAIEWSVVDMASYVNSLQGSIDVGWGLFRDVVNMFLIFILLYVSIRMILGGGGFNVKKTIRNVIIVALFINFSMLLTKVVIDAANILAVGIYDNIQNSENFDVSGSTNTGTATSTDATRNFVVDNVGLSGAIMRPILLTMIFDPDSENPNTLANAVYNPNLSEAVADAGESTLQDPLRVVVVGILGSIMMLITSFVFFAAGTMFIIRLGVLIMLMVVSPLAFASLAFPGLEKNFDEWLQKLVKNSFFAPVFLFLIYFVAYFMNDPNFIGGTKKMGLILNFGLAMVMMLTTLLVSNQMGVIGGKFAREWAGKLSFGLAGYLGRQTIGRAGKYVAENKDVQEWATSDNRFKKTLGRSLVYGGDKYANSSFDARNAAPLKNLGASMKIDFGKAETKGYEEISKKKAEDLAKYSKRYGVDKVAEEKAESDIKMADTSIDTEKKNIQEIDSGLRKIQEELAAADAGAMIPDYDDLVRKSDELKTKKEQAEQAKSDSEKRKNEAIAAKLRANRRRLYADSIETDVFSSGTKKSAADIIRKELGKGKKDKLLEDILKMAKDTEGEAPKKEEKTEGSDDSKK